MLQTQKNRTNILKDLSMEESNFKVYSNFDEKEISHLFYSEDFSPCGISSDFHGGFIAYASFENADLFSFLLNNHFNYKEDELNFCPLELEENNLVDFSLWIEENMMEKVELQDDSSKWILCHKEYSEDLKSILNVEYPLYLGTLSEPSIYNQKRLLLAKEKLFSSTTLFNINNLTENDCSNFKTDIEREFVAIVSELHSGIIGYAVEEVAEKASEWLNRHTASPKTEDVNFYVMDLEMMNISDALEWLHKGELKIISGKDGFAAFFHEEHVEQLSVIFTTEKLLER